MDAFDETFYGPCHVPRISEIKWRWCLSLAISSASFDRFNQVLEEAIVCVWDGAMTAHDRPEVGIRCRDLRVHILGHLKAASLILKWMNERDRCAIDVCKVDQLGYPVTICPVIKRLELLESLLGHDLAPMHLQLD